MKTFTILILVTLVSCSSSALYVPEARMISPEANGELWKTNLDFRAALYRRDRAHFENHDINKPLKRQGHKPVPTPHGEMGILPRLNFYLNPNFGANAPILGGAKYQLLGNPVTTAKKGNFSVAVTGGLGQQSSNFYVGWKSWEGQDKPDDVESVKFKTNHREVGLIAGHRWHDRFLHYVASYYFHQDITGDVKTEDAVLAHKRFDFTHDGVIYSMGFMYWFKEKFYMKGEYTHMMSAYSFSHQFTTNSGHLGLGFFF
jgi:hypothetical protein